MSDLDELAKQVNQRRVAAPPKRSGGFTRVLAWLVFLAFCGGIYWLSQRGTDGQEMAGKILMAVMTPVVIIVVIAIGVRIGVSK